MSVSVCLCLQRLSVAPPMFCRACAVRLDCQRATLVRSLARAGSTAVEAHQESHLPHPLQITGVWRKILTAVTLVSVVTNAFVIAISTNYLPRLVYAASNGNLKGYIDAAYAYSVQKDCYYEVRENGRGGGGGDGSRAEKNSVLALSNPCSPMPRTFATRPTTTMRFSTRL